MSLNKKQLLKQNFRCENFVPQSIMSQSGRDAGSESGENCDNFALFAPRGRASNNCWWKYGEGAAFFSPKLLPGIGNESDSEHAITYCIVINMLRDGARKQKKKRIALLAFFL